MIHRPALVRCLLGALAALGTAAAVAAGGAEATQPAPPAGDPPAAAVPASAAPAAPAVQAEPPTAATPPVTGSPPSDGTPPAASAPSTLPAEATAPFAAPTPAAAPAPPPARRAELPRREPVRPSLLPLAQPLWSELTPAQRQVLAPFEQNWNALPITEKRAWADLALRFPGMKADEKKRVEKRIAEWAELTPEQRRIARANYVLAQQVARGNLLAEWENYQSMTPEQRTVLGTVVNPGSNTAARHVTGPTGLAAIAAQPLPRRTSRAPAIAVGTDGSAASSAGVAPTVGPARTR